LKRADKREINFSQEVRDFVVTSNGFFLTSDVFNRLQVTSRQEKKNVVLTLLRLLKEGIIERHGSRDGCYRRIEGETDPIDFMNASTESVPVVLPFGIDDMVRIMPGNIILVAGEVESGKTTFLLNMTRDNMDTFQVHYFSSEMGAVEMRARLDLFDGITLDQWRFHPWERSADFADVIRPGSGNLNIIDFLEVYDNFYQVGQFIADIHKKLKGEVAIITVQKNPGIDLPLGGQRGLEKPRLALTLSRGGVCKIIKAKNWSSDKNPNGLATSYKIVRGWKLLQTGNWKREEK
jgi:hypothetical protein